MPFSELQNELGDKEKEYQDSLAQKRNIETKLHSLEEEKYEMDNEVEKQRSLLNNREREMDVLQKDYELAKEKEAVLMGDRSVMKQDRTGLIVSVDTRQTCTV